MLIEILMLRLDYFNNQARSSINPIQDDGGKKAPTSFSPVISTNVGIRSKNFLAFSFNPFSFCHTDIKFPVFI